MQLWVIATLAFAFGCCVGSFLNVVIWRLPRGGSIVRPTQSHCPHCNAAIAWYDNIPVLSWLILRARCRGCGGAISARYPLIELAGGVLFAGLLLAVYAGPLRPDAGDWPANWPGYLAAIILFSTLLAASIIDLEHFIIPLAVAWTGGLACLAVAAAFPGRGGLPLAGSPGLAAVGVGGGVGVLIAAGLLALGWIPLSFPDEQPTDRPTSRAERKAEKKARRREEKRLARQQAGRGRPDETAAAKPAADSVGATVHARREVLKELLFLAPPTVCAWLWWSLAAGGGPLAARWADWCQWAPLRGLGGALFGLLIGGAVVWAVRIIGTLIAGREAMGLGDVHLLAAAGAFLGWGGATLAFFVAPFFGLAVGVVQWLRHGRRELPFGPYLSLGALVVVLTYDWWAAWFGSGLGALLSR